MCSFDWEKCLLFIYSTWEKECAPSLKRVEKPLWRKKDPCTMTRDIDYHCSYWRHVYQYNNWTMTRDIEYQCDQCWGEQSQKSCTVSSEHIWDCVLVYQEKEGIVRKTIWTWENMLRSSEVLESPPSTLETFFFSSVFWVNAHYIYQVQNNFFFLFMWMFYQNPRKK